MHRILVIDDNPAIHDDFRKILRSESVGTNQLGAAAAALFGRPVPRENAPRFEIDCASRGQEGLEKVRAAAKEARPYAMAYVDVRMPNGWDGIETISRIWKEFSDLQVVICTAFSDHSWEEIQERLGHSDRFLILKKPFDNLEVRQLTFALAERARAERLLAESQHRLAAEGIIVQRLGSDITELKRTEEGLRKAREEADRANRAQSEFLSRVSHELRTPMNAILGFAQLLEMEENLRSEPREHIDEILRAGRHLLELINEVLDLSRIESGQMTISLEAVAVHELVSETIAMVAPLAAGLGVQLAMIPPEDQDWHLLADRQRLKQVLLIFLSNAIHYNRAQGTVTVECAASGNTDPTAFRIAVKDTGPGISAEKHARLFKPFDRLDAERTHTHVEGAGLGLAVSRRMVELMGGTVGVESTPGEGSNFWVELPRAESPLARYDRMGVAIETKVAAHTHTLVYIEDNLSNLKLINHILAQRPGLRLFAAMQGRTGLELVHEHSPALILLDLNLPDLGGHEVLARLQAEPKTSAIPVVVISADSSVGQIERLHAAGAHAFLTKPLDVVRFLEVIDRATAHPPTG